MSDWIDHSIDAEQSILGGLLFNNAAFPVVEKIIKPEHFFEPIHKSTYEVISQLISAGKLCNAVTIRSFLPANLSLGELNLGQYIARLAAVGADTINLREYCHSVRDLADLRALRSIANDILQSTNPDPSELGSLAVDAVDSVLSARSIQDSPSLSIGASVARAIDAAALAYQSESAVVGMSYGLTALDAKTGGFHKGELTIMAARPGQGKTMVALNFARELCSEKIHKTTGEVIKPAYSGIFYSLEMGDILLTQRILSDMIFMDGREVHYSKIRKGAIDETDFNSITKTALKLENMPLQIEQQGAMNLAQLGAKARQRKLKHGLDFIIVDYLQLMGVADRYKGNRVSEVSELSSGLLKLSKDLDIAVLALSQLNRNVESRDDKRPQLSDLRESGAIEQDASVVMMLYRPLYYLQNKEPRPGTPEYQQWTTEMEAVLHRLDIGIEKNRSGPSGGIEVYVNPAVNAVRDQVQDNHLPYRI